MKVGICTTSFPRFEGDVAGAFVLGFARALASRGHDVRVLAPEPHEGDGPPRLDGVELAWVPYMRPRALSRTFYGAGVPDNLRRDPRAWLGLAPFAVSLSRHVAETFRDRDALVSHWALPSALAAGASRGGRPHLAVLHSADVHALATLPFGAAVARRVAASATAMLFVSDGLRDRFLALLPALERARVMGRCHVSAMGIDESDAHGAGTKREARSRLGLDRFTVLAMGRLVPIKGLEVAIDAFAARDGWELVLAGEGPARPALARRASLLGARARFAGIVTGDRKRDFLRGADAYVLPSVELGSGRTEGLPTALLEAMLAKLPVVASDTGGVRDVVTHDRSGLLVTPGSVGELAGALDRLSADGRLRRRLGSAAHTVAKRYRWSELAPHIESLLRSEA